MRSPAPEQVTIYDLETGAARLVFPIDARECVAMGRYSYEKPIGMTEVGDEQQLPDERALESEEDKENSEKESQDADAEDAQNAEENGEDAVLMGSAKKQGRLPAGFPGKVALDEAGHGTYAKLRNLVSGGGHWWADVPGVGDATAAQIEAALNE